MSPADRSCFNDHMPRTTPPVPLVADATVGRVPRAVALVGGLRGALRSGLIDALWRWQPCTSDELATRAHLVHRAVELTLAALSAGGVVTEDRGLWTLSAPPQAWAGFLAVDEQIGRYVETGVPPYADQADGCIEDRRLAERFHGQVADWIAPTLVHPHVRMLELGAGTAPWSRALLTIEPTATAVAVDLAPVIERLDRDIAEAALAGRLIGVPGDLRTIKLAGRFDVVVVSGLCRHLSDADSAALFERCRGWLAEGGRLFVCDALADTVDAGGALALYALGLAARSRAETLRSTDDYQRWFRLAGLARPQFLPTGLPEATVLISEDPTNQRATP
jgi:SAM-dependent methyltransferase